MDREQALKQIDEALAIGATAPEGSSPNDAVGTFATATLYSAISRFTQPGSSYEKDVESIRELDKRSYPGYVAPRLFAILKSIRREISSGYFESLTGLIRADTFADFLSMADHLLSEGYKDPAAVLGGSVLEQHLRALADKALVSTTMPDGRPKSADVINSDLVKATIYHKTVQKNVTSWLGLRNDAAHGHYEKYEHANVRLMLDGISLFVQQHPL